jgi:hypothetical protein
VVVHPASLRRRGRISTAARIGENHGVEKETLGGFAKTMADGVGREKPVCRQPLPPVQAGSFNLAVVIEALNSTITLPTAAGIRRGRIVFRSPQITQDRFVVVVNVQHRTDLSQASRSSLN